MPKINRPKTPRSVLKNNSQINKKLVKNHNTLEAELKSLGVTIKHEYRLSHPFCSMISPKKTN